MLLKVPGIHDDPLSGSAKTDKYGGQGESCMILGLISH
jgi:hypothetical protein